MEKKQAFFVILSNTFVFQQKTSVKKQAQSDRELCLLRLLKKTDLAGIRQVAEGTRILQHLHMGL